jgi:hypothetical protein
MGKCPNQPQGPTFVEAQPMMLLPPRPDRCQTCATKHAPGEPHNAQSMYYLVSFAREHGRSPTWADAMAHCDETTRAAWTAELKKLGAWDGD